MKGHYRNLLLRQYGHLYEKLGSVSQDECWYCKSLRDSVDHCPPVCVLDSFDCLKFKEQGGSFVLVPSCQECNHLLGAKLLYTPKERAAYLLQAYHKLYDKVSFKWSAEEVADMGFALKSLISTNQAKADEYLRKLKALEQAALESEDTLESLKQTYELVGLGMVEVESSRLGQVVEKALPRVSLLAELPKCISPARSTEVPTEVSKGYALQRFKQLTRPPQATVQPKAKDSVLSKPTRSGPLPGEQSFYAIQSKALGFYLGVSRRTVNGRSVQFTDYSNLGELAQAKLTKRRWEAVRSFRANGWTEDYRLVEVFFTEEGLRVAKPLE